MSKSKSPMTLSAAKRIQSAEANGGQVAKGGFAARAQSAAAKHCPKIRMMLFVTP